MDPYLCKHSALEVEATESQRQSQLGIHYEVRSAKTNTKTSYPKLDDFASALRFIPSFREAEM